jgi:hypothetical protein
MVTLPILGVKVAISGFSDARASFPLVCSTLNRKGGSRENNGI